MELYWSNYCAEKLYQHKSWINMIAALYHKEIIAPSVVSTDKTPIDSADILNDRVTPFFAEYDLDILRILTGRGAEYCGSLEHHAFQLYLSIEGIEHKLIRLRLMVFVSASIRL